jgi:hypothetical protein
MRPTFGRTAPTTFYNDAMRVVWILAIACSSAQSPKSVSTDERVVAVDAAVKRPAPEVGQAACDGPHPADWRPTASFLGSGRVVHLRVASSIAGPVWATDRCVALDLEVVGVYRGDGAAGEHVNVVIRQSVIEHARARPAGAWWSIPIDPGTEYVAFCPVGSLASLRGSCTVMVAKELLQDLRFARDTEAAKLPLATVLALFKTECPTASYVATSYLWEKFGETAAKDPAAYDAFVTSVEEPTCSRIARATLFDSLYGVVFQESTPHVRRIVRAMFHLLDVAEANDLHDNLIGTWLPNALGIVGGAKKWTATEIFAGAPALRAAAVKALAAYQGRSDATGLRAWLGARP